MTTWLPTEVLEDFPVPLQNGVAVDVDPKAEQNTIGDRDMVSHCVDRIASGLSILTTLAAGGVVMLTGVGLVLRMAQQVGLLRGLLD